MKRRILVIDPAAARWRLETLDVQGLEKDQREDYFVLSGETLCQYLVRRDPVALVIARGPLPFISGNKASVGYISPLTGLPHYSFIGGRAAAQLLNLGLDAICFQSDTPPSPALAARPGTAYVVVSGRAPELTVDFRPSAGLPDGQRSAYYWLLERELGGDRYAGSIFTVGDAARLGYRSANLAADVIYHAGRGGAGAAFSRFALALVLRGVPLEPREFFGDEESALARNPNAALSPLLEKHCARLSSGTGGTIVKLFTTGADPAGRNTLPAWNAQRLGTPLADLGGPQVLRATRAGQTGCHWCQVDCRHYHWVPVDYAPDQRDMFLDDFEPTYALFAMLGLSPSADTLEGRLDLLAEVDRRLILPIEQLGCDALDVGLGLAALFEGIERGVIPDEHVPDFMAQGPGLGHLDAAVQAVAMLRSGEAAQFAALRAVGDGPQALARQYPSMRDIVFTGGRGTLGNAGHCNALWTFLMPFSRFFGHYVGQYYKVEEELPPPGADEEAYQQCFAGVVQRLLAREFFWLLANALSQCAFTFVIFSQDGQGEKLSDDDLLLHLLRSYGIQTTRADLAWFGQAFWAQSIALKCEFGWRPPAAADFPLRVYEALSLALGRSPEELRSLMEMLISEWRRQAGEVLKRFGYDTPWQEQQARAATSRPTA
jgi:aldehyde:ferredoxin oxidoreductase